MKKIFLTIVFVLFASNANANFQCGIQPIKPYNCYRGQAVCMCNSRNQWWWEFQGC